MDVCNHDRYGRSELEPVLRVVVTTSLLVMLYGVLFVELHQAPPQRSFVTLASSHKQIWQHWQPVPWSRALQEEPWMASRILTNKQICQHCVCGPQNRYCRCAPAGYIEMYFQRWDKCGRCGLPPCNAEFRACSEPPCNWTDTATMWWSLDES